jgi:hypothetical protein
VPVFLREIRDIAPSDGHRLPIEPNVSTGAYLVANPEGCFTRKG